MTMVNSGLTGLNGCGHYVQGGEGEGNAGLTCSYMPVHLDSFAAARFVLNLVSISKQICTRTATCTYVSPC